MFEKPARTNERELGRILQVQRARAGPHFAQVDLHWKLDGEILHGV